MYAGVCLDAINPYGRPSVRSINGLILPPHAAHRLVAFDEPRWFWYAQELADARIGLPIVLTGQSFPVDVLHGDFEWYCAEWTRQLKLLYEQAWLILIFGNEFNVSHDATWPPGGLPVYIRAWNRFANAALTITDQIELWMGGIYSVPDPIAQIAEMWPHLHPKPAGIDFHLYDHTLEQTEQILREAKRRFGVKAAVGEWNDAVVERIPPFQRMLSRMCDWSNWFCWSEGMVPQHGLVTTNNVKLPTYYALRDEYARL
jgi:hypothetical protein